jgi:hypothetical protein
MYDTTIPDHHRTAVTIAIAALVLGIAGDLLLRWIPWGVSALLWTVLFCAAARYCSGRVAWFPMICALLAATGILWRDSDTLVTLDVLLLLLFLPMIALEARGVRLAAAGLAEIAGGIIVTGAQMVIGLPQLIFRDLSWSRMPHVGGRSLGIAARGTLIAAPMLVIFGSLLASADPTFGRVLRDLLVFDPGEAVQHLIVTAIATVLCAGFLRSLALSGPMPRPSAPPALSLPAAETNFALALLNILFALFVAVQFRYFFGAAPAELAQYARRGFFELVWVVALIVPMLLMLEWLVTKERGFALFRGLAALQVTLVFIIAASAFHRMELYRDEYGLTQLRFYTTAFMIWLAVLLLWFVCTVLTGRRQRFAIGALATGVAAVVALHVINPDGIIVETNIERTRAGKRSFDDQYARMLSDDAAPMVFANRDVVGEKVFERFLWRQHSTDWRTWNVSRAKARELFLRIERHSPDRSPMTGSRIDSSVQ